MLSRKSEKHLRVSVLGLLLSSALMFFLTSPAFAVSDAWSATRPTSSVVYHQTIGNSTTDGIAAVGLGVEILEYVENSATFQGKDYLSFRVSASANTRVGIKYKMNSVSAITWWRATSTPTGISSDDSGKWFDLPYPFRFYGKVYRKVWVCSNGFMSFDSNSVSYSPKSIPDSSIPNTLVAGFWRDLNPAKGGSITYYSGLDSSNLYTFVVTWDKVPNYGNSNTQTFQITLRQSSTNYEDDIIFSYDAVTLDYTTTIGIEDQTGLKGTSYSSSSIDPDHHTLYFTSDILPKTISYLTIEVQKSPMDYSSAINIQTSETGGYNVKLKETSNLVGDLFLLAIKTAAPILIGTATSPLGGIICKLILVTPDIANILSSDLSPPQLVGEHGCPFDEGLAYVKAQGYLEDPNDWYLYDSTLATTFIWVFSDPSTEAHSVYINAKLEYYDHAAGSKTISSQCFVALGVGGGGGCPTLFVWNGTDYTEEGILDIHAESDVTVQHEIQNSLVLENGVYKLQLRELDEHTSHIDQVKLYAVDYQGKWNLCPLTYAYHNELGKVKTILQFDDEIRVDLEPTETIELKFSPSISYSKTAYFIFEINGYNVKIP